MAVDSEPKSLAATLVQVANRQPRNFYRQPGDQDERKYPVLARIVKAVKGPEAWRDSPSTALIDVLRLAINALPEKMSGRYPRTESLPPGDPAWHGRPERQIAELLYGYRDNELPLRYNVDGSEAPRSYDDDRLPAALRLANVELSAPKQRGRVSSIIREDLADALLSLERAAIERSAPSADADPDSAMADALEQPSYVSRPDYEQSLTKHCREGAKVILLYGEAGTGKTTLAEHCGRLLQATSVKASSPTSDADSTADPSEAVFAKIDASSSGALIDDLIRVLYNRSIEIPPHDVLVKDIFRELLATSNTPQFIVIDNVSDSKTVNELVPPSPNATVLITSRYLLSSAPIDMIVNVQEMEEGEALALIDLHIPGLELIDAKRLAEALCYRPLAITHACGYLSQEDTTVADFCTLLSESIAATLDAMTDDELTLTAIYRLTIGGLDPDSLSILELIVAVGGGNVSYEFLRTVWQGGQLIAFEPRKETVSTLRLKKSIRALERRCLVRQLTLFGSGDRYVWMHSLTRDILHELRNDECELIYHRLLSLAEDSTILNDWQPGRSLPLRIASQAADLRFVLTTLIRLATDVFPYPDLATLAAFIIRCESQYGPEYTDKLASPRRVLRQYSWLILASNYWMSDNRREDESLPEALKTIYERGQIPLDEQDLLRRYQASVVLGNELTIFRSHFLQPPSGKSFRDWPIASPQKMLSPDRNPRFQYWSPQLARLMLGIEGLVEAIIPTDQQLLSQIATQRQLAQDAHSYQDHFREGEYHFAIGASLFDACRYADALSAYTTAYNIWSSDPRRNVGEVCKVAMRITDVFCRMGDYATADVWRNVVIATATSHVEQFGAAEWTADHGSNLALYRAACGFPLRYPSTMADLPPPITITDRYAQIFGGAGHDVFEIFENLAAGDDEAMAAPFFDYATARRYAARRPREALAMLHNWLPRVRQLRTTHIRFFLESIKIAMHVDELEGAHSCSSDTLWYALEAARGFQLGRPAPYWYADGLLTAYALCVRYQCGDAEQAAILWTQLEEACSAVDRTDKLQIARAAQDQNFIPLWLLAD